MLSQTHNLVEFTEYGKLLYQHSLYMSEVVFNS